MMLTVKDLLQIKSIEGIRVVAGEKGLDNQISIVNIMENPDTFDWLTSNELLLSTGYIFKDNLELQNRIIKELAEINCAGLCIKIKRYFDQIPQNMIDLANQYGLPILELPYGYTLSQIISIINESRSSSHDLLNRKALDIHNSLFSIALQGGGIDQISSELARTIQNPIIILDKDFQLIHYTDLEDNQLPINKYLNLVKNWTIFPADFTDGFPENISQIKKSIKRIFNSNGYMIKCKILPVAVANTIYGYIVVWQTLRELTELDYIGMEQASTIIALERIKAREIEDIKLNIRQEFFDDLLSGKITQNDTLQALCDLHGIISDNSYYCLVFNLESINLSKNEDLISRKYKLESRARKCIDLIHDYSENIMGEIICFNRKNQIIILIGKNEYNPSASIMESKNLARELCNYLQKELLETVLIGIGKQYKSILTLHKSYSEAHKAIRITKQFGSKTGVSHFEDYSVYHFLGSNHKTSDLEDFFMKYLGKIYEHDREHGTSYLITLECYFNKNNNLAETAKTLFIHRNTLIYRIEKIKEILNIDLKNYEELFQIQLALKIYRLLHNLAPY